MRSAMVVASDVDDGSSRPRPDARSGAEGRRSGARFQPAGIGRQDLQALGLQGQAGGGPRLVPEGVHAGLHDRVQVARGARRHDQEVQRAVLHGQRRPARGREGQQGVRRGAQAPTSRCSSDPTKKTAEAYGVLNQRGVANRWTFYIGKDGKILAIDKTIKPATSAEDMAAKLGELKVEPAKP